VSVTASAPGKLVLTGEYAVLAGAPALVMAADRRARVALTPADEPSGCSVRSTGGADGTTRYGFDGHAWTVREGAPLPLVDAILNDLEPGLDLAGAPAFSAELDTSAFMEPGEGGGRRKLGLGSSAALTVAFASALAEYTGRLSGRQDRWIGRLIAVHRRFQGGRGSGLDIAASLSGGVISYRMNGAVENPAVLSRPLPDSFHLLCIWSGRPVSTEAALQRLERWKAEEPRAQTRALSELAEVAVAADGAARASDGRALVDAISSYGNALRRFGAASGIEIYGPAHERLATLAREHGAAYKPCGAGGGDVGVACSDDAATLDALRVSIEGAGFRALALAVDPVGLQVQPSLE
jgi:phosphomevalonate kinase